MIDDKFIRVFGTASTESPKKIFGKIIHRRFLQNAFLIKECK